MTTTSGMPPTVPSGGLSSRLLLGPLTFALVMLNPLSQLGYLPVSVVAGDQAGIGLGLVGMTVGAHAIASGAGAIIFGPLLDLVPVRRVLPPALALNASAAAVQLAGSSFPLLLAGRIATGLTTALLMLAAAVINIDAHHADAGRRDRGFSQLQTFNSIGAAIGLGIGAAAAALDMPALYFGVVAAYGFLLLAAFPLIARRLPTTPAASDVSSHTAGRPRRLGVLARDIRGMLGATNTVRLLVAAASVTWVMQAAHYGVSVLVGSGEVSTLQRVLLPMVIPVGVFSGSLLNQRLLRGRPALTLLRGYYLLLPPVVALLAGALVAFPLAAQVVVLVVVGAVTGAMLPLSVAAFVAWHAHVRSSAAAAENAAKAFGAAVSPMVLGAATVVLETGLAILATAGGGALIGLLAVAGFNRRALDRGLE